MDKSNEVEDRDEDQRGGGRYRKVDNRTTYGKHNQVKRDEIPL